VDNATRPSQGPSVLDRILSPLRLAVGFGLTAASSAALVPAAAVMLASRPARIKLCNYYGKLLGPALIKTAGVTPIIRHRERVKASAPAIYVSNHTSILDVFFAISICPVGGCGIAKKEIGNIPFFGWLYRLSGHLLIDRSDREGSIAAMDKTVEVVRKHNLSIWMWPEGTRSKDGRLLPMKKGLAHLAIATGLPIVPVVLHNAHRNWPKNEMVLMPTTVEVDILEAIDTRGWKLETIEEHLAEVHQAFADALGPEQKPLVEQGGGPISTERPATGRAQRQAIGGTDASQGRGAKEAAAPSRGRSSRRAVA
jgi:1-acyl-sn-glycerol-3-phosphate acyltransferase